MMMLERYTRCVKQRLSTPWLSEERREAARWASTDGIDPLGVSHLDISTVSCCSQVHSKDKRATAGSRLGKQQDSAPCWTSTSSEKVNADANDDH
jgi:hypothetical protein